MPDRDQGDHWDFLAADLGALPTPDKEEAKEEEPVCPQNEADPSIVEESIVEPSVEEFEEVEFVEDVAEVDEVVETDVPTEKPKERQRGRTGDRVVSGFGHRRGGVDWANLARELGVEAMEEAPAPIPAADTPDELEAPTMFDRVADELEEVVSEKTEAVDLSPEHVDSDAEPVSSGFGAGLIDDLGTEGAAQAEAADTEEPQEERKGRRRRRRRKPRKPEQDQKLAVEAVIVEEEETEAASTPQDEKEEESSPRRRGRRRGGRKRTPREEVTTESEGADEGVREAKAKLVDEDDDQDEFEIFDADDFDEDESPQEGASDERSRDRRSSKKVTHRGIPSWDEAVGHIIDTNMEDRSKKPESSGFRRRRGGDRSANRGRS